MDEQKSNLAKAIISVMKEVKGMEKNSRVGSGNYAYDGTKDQDVKEVFNEVMAKHGLCILPTDIVEDTQIDRWKEGDRMKQSIFTKVSTKYLLLHESGESQTLAGYGHGVDNQDKGAGKATTYALKNALLASFLTPVGKIEDSDSTHSNDHQTPPKKDDKEWLNPNTMTWSNVVKALSDTTKNFTLDQVKSKYKISKANELKLKDDVTK